MEEAAARNERKKSKKRGYVEPPPVDGEEDKGKRANDDPVEGKREKQK